MRRRRPVEDGGEVELLDDVGGRGDQHPPDGDALDVHAQDRPGHGLGFGGVPGQLDATGLAATADQHLGLDDDLLGAGREEMLGRRAGSGPVPAMAHAGTGSPSATRSDFASASWIFTAGGWYRIGFGEAADQTGSERRIPGQARPRPCERSWTLDHAVERTPSRAPRGAPRWRRHRDRRRRPATMPWPSGTRDRQSTAPAHRRRRPAPQAASRPRRRWACRLTSSRAGSRSPR